MIWMNDHMCLFFLDKKNEIKRLAKDAKVTNYFI